MMRRMIISATMLLWGVLAAFAGNERPDSTMITRHWQKKVPASTLTGYSPQVSGDDLTHPVTTDMRNRLAGLVPGLEIEEIMGYQFTVDHGNYGLSDSDVGTWFRGNWPTCIVDGIPTPYFQLNLQPNQIESITLISDVADKVAYGPIASEGSLLITTRKGAYNTPLRVTAEVETGLETPSCLPEWVNGYEYLLLNNQARANSGYTQLYTEEDIEGYRNGNPYDMKYPNVDYKSLMLYEVVPLSSVGVNLNGGSSIIKYNVSLNGQNRNDIFKLGKGDINRINLSTSITAKVGKYLEANVSFVGSVGYRRKLNNMFTDWYVVPATAYPLELTMTEDSPYYDVDLIGDQTIYANSRTWRYNTYAQEKEGGYKLDKNRSGMFNATLDFDLGWLVKGLKSRTMVNLNTYFYYGLSKGNDYLAYYWDYQTGDYDGTTSHVGTKTSGRSEQSTFTYQSLNMYENLDWSRTWGDHSVSASGVFFMSDAAHSANTYYMRQVNSIASADYSFRGKYNFNAVLEYAGTSRYNRANRFQFFPAAGFSWVVSDEDFLSSSKAVDYLKFRTQVGKAGDVDVFGTNYLYNSVYSTLGSVSFGPGTVSPWFGSNAGSQSTTTLVRIENPDLTWEKSWEVDMGIDARLFGCLDLTLNGYYYSQYDLITVASYNYARAMGADEGLAYVNTDAYDTRGYEFGIRYSGRCGDFRYDIGGTAAAWKTIIRKYDADYSTHEYNKIIGVQYGTMRGYKCIGRFQSQEEIDNSPVLTAQTKIGDLKYADLNDDGLIDYNDVANLDTNVPKLRYSLHLDLGWKNFGLYVLGTGRAFYKQQMTTSYFWNGWGECNYSAFVRDNVGGDYPSLQYDKNPNNFVLSDFWIKDSGYFKIQTVDISYDIKMKESSKIDGIRLDLRGSNLATFTRLKYVDPESITAGVETYPLFTAVTLGARITF